MALPQLSIQTSLSAVEFYRDIRNVAGSNCSVRLPRTTTAGGGTICKGEDPMRCAVAGQESLRILKTYGPSEPVASNPESHKSAMGPGGYRIEASRNLWEGSGLKIDSASTDVAWGRGPYSNKVITSARNGELIMWDLNKSSPSKYERRTKDHSRSIHQLSISHIVEHYCITGSADGDLRVWDLRDFNKSIMRIRHPTSVRTVVFSSSVWKPLQAAVGLDNGSIYRWDLAMGQRGKLDQLPLAHTSAVTSLDWRPTTSNSEVTHGLGWLVSAGLDKCVKVWDVTVDAHIPNKATYTLHPSFPVRRVLWRPEYDCEIAIVSNVDVSAAPETDLSIRVPGLVKGLNTPKQGSMAEDAVEIWDVRRSWIPKWSARVPQGDGNVTDISFPSPDCIWSVFSSGSFAQMDLREVSKPIDAIPRVGMSWEASGSVVFVSDHAVSWEVPYDDIVPEERASVSERMGHLIKALGDQTYIPKTQDVGALNLTSEDDFSAFINLAKSYAFEGDSPVNLCEKNAQMTFELGKERDAQVWLLLGAALSEIAPPLLPPKLRGQPNSTIQHSTPASSVFTFPNSLKKPSPARISSELSPRSISQHNSNEFPRSTSTASRRSATSRKTPDSSTPSSPLHQFSTLPPLTPLVSRGPYMGRRGSADSRPEVQSSAPSNTSGRKSSLYRRPSVSLHSASPSLSERTSSANTAGSSNNSLRHVGEGALDDSDSDGSIGESNLRYESEDEEDMNVNSRPLISPALVPARNIVHPSPLSRVAGQGRWTEDESSGHERDFEGENVTVTNELEGLEQEEDDAPSPSPQSTESESDGNKSLSKRKSNLKGTKRNSSAAKSKQKQSKPSSRNSTLVSNSVAIAGKQLEHKTSKSSVQTVLAGEDDVVKRPGQEDTITDLASAMTHRRLKSQAVSELALDTGELQPNTHDSPLSRKHPEYVHSEDTRLQAMTWETLRECMECLADEGDVQLCTMLSLVAGKELNIRKSRMLSFLDAYIDQLSRLRLHSCAASLRKFCNVNEIQSSTMMETTIYTSCARCRKPLLQSTLNVGKFYVCSSCKTIVTCVICHLPVRGLLFQCSVCTHGGHYMCYRRYYNSLPVSPIPEPIESPRHATDSSVEEDNPSHSARLVGQKCAAGCGHFCWASARYGGHEVEAQ